MVGLTVNIMAVYFLFILIFGNKSAKYHSAIIFLASIALTLFPLPTSYDTASYLAKRETYIMLDGATALALTMFMSRDKVVFKQALLLAFACLCHIMIILHFKTSYYYVWAISKFFYMAHNELIITIGLLQMMVSYDGLIRALSNLQSLLLRTYYYLNRSYQSLFARKTSEKRT